MRAKRLWESVIAHNKDNIPFYFSVPAKDLDLFQSHICDNRNTLRWISDEQVINANPTHNLLKYYHQWDGRLTQQIIKAEFWRVIPESVDKNFSYLCIDSESVFIKDFFISDFLNLSGVPYTVLHQNKDLLQLAANKKIKKVSESFDAVCGMIKSVFDRKGPNYDFGPTPVIWSSRVWNDLDRFYLRSQGITIWEAIKEKPSEIQWYGESLLHFKSIPLFPIEPLFKVYHYNWHYYCSRKLGESPDVLRSNYLGYLCQSNWDFADDWGEYSTRKSLASKLIRSIKNSLARFR